LRLEIDFNCDKKKSELYFSFSVKKILTEKPNRACPKATNFRIVGNASPPSTTPAFSLLHQTDNVFLRL